MKVPIYKNSETIDPARVPTPDIPTKPREAFGNKGKDIENLGNTIGDFGDKLYDYGLKKKEIEDDERVESAYTSYQREVNDTLFNNETEVYDDNGIERERPVGILNRKLGSSRGALADYNKKYNDIASKHMQMFDDKRLQTKLGAKMRRYGMSKYSEVNRHEAVEWQKNHAAIYDTSKAEQIGSMTMAQQPDALQDSIENLADTIITYHNSVGTDPTVSKAEVEESIVDGVRNSLNGSLEYDVDGDVARDLLEFAHKNPKEDYRISDKAYNKLKAEISSNSAKLKKERKTANEATQTSNLVDIVDGLLEKGVSGISLTDITKMDKDAELPTGAAEALNKFTTVIREEGSVPDDELASRYEVDQAYVDATDAALEIMDPKDLGEYIVNLFGTEAFFTEEKNRNKAIVLFHLAKNIGFEKGKPEREKIKRYKDNLKSWTEMSGIEMKGAPLENYNELVLGGMDPKDAMTTAVQNEIDRQGGSQEKEEKLAEVIKSVEGDMSAKGLMDINAGVTHFLMKNGLPVNEAVIAADEITEAAKGAMNESEYMFTLAEGLNKVAPTLKQYSPEMAVMYKRAQDVAKIDEALIKDSSKMGIWGKLQESFNRGNLDTKFDLLASQYLVNGKVVDGDYDTDILPYETKFLEGMSRDPIDTGNMFTNLPYALANMAPASIKGLSQGALYGMFGAIAGTVMGSPTGIGAVAPATVLGTTGFAYGSASFWYEQGKGSIARDLHRDGVSPEIYRPISIIGGSIYGAIEFLQLGWLVGATGGVGKNALKQLITDSTRQALIKGGAFYTLNYFSELNEEGLQELTMSISKDVANDLFGNNKTAKEIFVNATTAYGKGVSESALPMLALVGGKAAFDAKGNIDYEKYKGITRNAMARNVINIAKLNGMEQNGEISLLNTPYLNYSPIQRSVSRDNSVINIVGPTLAENVEQDLREQRIKEEIADGPKDNTVRDENGDPIVVRAAEVGPEFTEENQSAALDYLAQYIPPEYVVRMDGNERLRVANMSAEDFRDYVVAEEYKNLPNETHSTTDGRGIPKEVQGELFDIEELGYGFKRTLNDGTVVEMDEDAVDSDTAADMKKKKKLKLRPVGEEMPNKGAFLSENYRKATAKVKDLIQQRKNGIVVPSDKFEKAVKAQARAKQRLDEYNNPPEEGGQQAELPPKEPDQGDGGQVVGEDVEKPNTEEEESPPEEDPGGQVKVKATASLDPFIQPRMYEKGKPGISEVPEISSADQAVVDQSKRAFVFRDEDGNPQGVLAFIVKEDGTLETRSDYGANVEVVVNADFRRQGIATQLYDTAKKQGYDLDKVENRAYTEDGANFQNARIEKQNKKTRPNRKLAVEQPVFSDEDIAFFDMIDNEWLSSGTGSIIRDSDGNVIGRQGSERTFGFLSFRPREKGESRKDYDAAVAESGLKKKQLSGLVKKITARKPLTERQKATALRLIEEAKDEGVYRSAELSEGDFIGKVDVEGNQSSVLEGADVTEAFRDNDGEFIATIHQSEDGSRYYVVDEKTTSVTKFESYIDAKEHYEKLAGIEQEVLQETNVKADSTYMEKVNHKGKEYKVIDEIEEKDRILIVPVDADVYFDEDGVARPNGSEQHKLLGTWINRADLDKKVDVETDAVEDYQNSNNHLVGLRKELAALEKKKKLTPAEQNRLAELPWDIGEAESNLSRIKNNRGSAINPFPNAEKAENWYQKIINKFASIEGLMKVAKQLGIEVESGEDAALAADRHLSIGAQVDSLLNDGTFVIDSSGKHHKTGEGMRPILEDYDKNSTEKDPITRSEDLQKYTVAMRTIYDLQRQKNKWTKDKIVTEEQVAQAKQDLAELEEKYGEEGMAVFKDFQKRIVDFQNRILHLLVDSGNMAQAHYDQIVRMNPNYIPFDRILPDSDYLDAGGVPISKKGFEKAKTPVKKIKGSELPIHPVLERVIKNAYKIMDIASRNTVFKNVHKMANIEGTDVKVIQPKQVPVANIQHRAAVDQEFMDTLINFAKSLGAKFQREGQITRRAGAYYSNDKRITRKFGTPREVLAHEAGHFFDDKFGLSNRFYNRGITKAVAEEMIGLMDRMGESNKRKSMPKERFADAFEWWLVHREQARNEIPLFSGHMALIIEQTPELRPLLDMKPSPRMSVETMTETIFRPSPFKPKGNVVEGYIDGEKVYLEVPKNLHEALSGMNEAASHWAIRILSYPATWLRHGATVTPEFMGKNFFRDQHTAFLQTQIGFIPFVDSVGAFADIIKKSDVYVEWIQSGGSYGGFVETSRPALAGLLREIQEQPNMLKNLNIINPVAWFKGLGKASQFLEQATRLGAYKAAKRRGMSDVEAAYEARESTVNFSRKGSDPKLKDFASVKAFFNAGLQAFDKSVRTAAKDPKGLTIKAVTTITAPSIILYLRNREEEDYFELPRWQRDLFWHIKINDKWYLYPKPFGYGQIFGTSVERFMEYADTKDPKAFDGMADSIISANSPIPTSGVIGSILPTSILSPIENKANWSFHRQRKLISDWDLNVPNDMQYNKYTSEVAKGLGAVTNNSPVQIENMIQGYTGSSGRYALSFGDELMRRLGGPKKGKRPTELSDYPGLKGIIARNPTGTLAQSVNDFYTSRKKITEEYNGIKKRKAEGNYKDALAREKANPETRLYKTFNKAAKYISDINQRIEKITNNERISDDTKRRQLKILDEQIVKKAQEMNKQLKKLKDREK